MKRYTAERERGGAGGCVNSVHNNKRGRGGGKGGRERGEGREGKV